MSIIGPNTAIDSSLIASDIILCCGEDPEELLDCVRRTCGIGNDVPHRYRGFGCLRLSSFSLVWGGIGTGTLEPLLWELLQSNLVRRIVLVGTAGALGRPEKLGHACVITEAYLAGTALDEARIEQPLRPDFPGFQALVNLPAEAIISTDFYYGFASRDQGPAYPDIMRRAMESYSKHAHRAGLIDMETGQFYFLCNAFGGERNIEYLAIKGPANSVADVGAQLSNSAAVLIEALSAAVGLLEVRRRAESECQ